MATKQELIARAQEKLSEVIDMLEIACEGNATAEAYMIDHLKIMCSNDHGFLSSELNLDILFDVYEDNNEDVGGDEYFEIDYEI